MRKQKFFSIFAGFDIKGGSAYYFPIRSFLEDLTPTKVKLQCIDCTSKLVDN